MVPHFPFLPISWTALTISLCVLMFLTLLSVFYFLNRHGGSFYFDAQDFCHYEGRGDDPLTVNGRQLPLSAKGGTFDPLLDKYIGVVKLLLTVAAASIAFGPNGSAAVGIAQAKIVLAFSVLYGVMFSALLLFFYDDYAQNVRSYRPIRYSLIQALGFASLVCFVGGYLLWALYLA